jgi:hypothetical protein
MERERLLEKTTCGFTLCEQGSAVRDAGLFGSDAGMGGERVEPAQPLQGFVAAAAVYGRLDTIQCRRHPTHSWM